MPRLCLRASDGELRAVPLQFCRSLAALLACPHPLSLAPDAPCLRLARACLRACRQVSQLGVSMADAMNEVRAALPLAGRAREGPVAAGGGRRSQRAGSGAARQALLAEVLGFLMYCEWRVDRGAVLAEISATCGRLSAVGRAGRNLVTCSDLETVCLRFFLANLFSGPEPGDLALVLPLVTASVDTATFQALMEHVCRALEGYPFHPASMSSSGSRDPSTADLCSTLRLLQVAGGSSWERGKAGVDGARGAQGGAGADGAGRGGGGGGGAECGGGFLTGPLEARGGREPLLPIVQAAKVAQAAPFDMGALGVDREASMALLSAAVLPSLFALVDHEQREVSDTYRKSVLAFFCFESYRTDCDLCRSKGVDMLSWSALHASYDAVGSTLGGQWRQSHWAFFAESPPLLCSSLVELEQLQARLLHYSDKFNLAGTETKLPSLLWNGSSVSSYFKDAPTMYLTAAAYLEMGRATGCALESSEPFLHCTAYFEMAKQLPHKLQVLVASLAESAVYLFLKRQQAFVLELHAERRCGVPPELGQPQEQFVLQLMSELQRQAKKGAMGSRPDHLQVIATRLVKQVLTLFPGLLWSPQLRHFFVSQTVTARSGLVADLFRWFTSEQENLSPRACVLSLVCEYVWYDLGMKLSLPDFLKMSGCSKKALESARPHRMLAQLSAARVLELSHVNLPRMERGKSQLIPPELLRSSHTARRSNLDEIQRLCLDPLENLSRDCFRTAVHEWHALLALYPDLAANLIRGVSSAWSRAAAEGFGLFAPSAPRFASLSACASVRGRGGAEAGSGLEEQEKADPRVFASQGEWLQFLSIWLPRFVGGGFGETEDCRLVMECYTDLLADSLEACPQPQSSHGDLVYLQLLLLGLQSIAHMGWKDSLDFSHSVFSCLFTWLADINRALPTPVLGAAAVEGSPRPEVLPAGVTALQKISAQLRYIGHTEKENSLPLRTGSVQVGPLCSSLEALVDLEIRACNVWLAPAAARDSKGNSGLASRAGQAVDLWRLNHSAALAVVSRYGDGKAKQALEAAILNDCEDPAVRRVPEVIDFLASAPSPDTLLKVAEKGVLTSWAATNLVSTIQLFYLAANTVIPYAGGVVQYAVRCLGEASETDVVFMLPQIVQLLRLHAEAVSSFVLRTVRKSPKLCAQILWALETEMRPPEEAFNPTIKRSGWEPPQDTGLWDAAGSLRDRILATLPAAEKALVDTELAYFETVNDVSSALGGVEKADRRARLRELLAEVPADPLQAGTVYMPFCEEAIVESLVPESGVPLASAAKIPILVNFNTRLPGGEAKVLGCIFKVGDDCRQDVLALQFVELLKRIMAAAELDPLLTPYRVIPTGYERGVIELVANSKSRSELGLQTDGGLAEVFQRQYGVPGTPKYEQARRQFMRSSAGYAVASFLLQMKDRHNGNILVHDDGRMVHIDFGFILTISPGGNLGFETAGFKLSHEMSQIIDPTGNQRSPEFREFLDLCVKGYLAARRWRHALIPLVGQMRHSGLPCFGYGKPMEGLVQRFQPGASEEQAARFFAGVVRDAYRKWTTHVYDVVQYLQQGIPK